MSNDLDHLLARLAANDGSGPDGLEAAVMQGIARRRKDLRKAKALAPVRAASVGLALAVGVAAGGMEAAATLSRPAGLDTFSITARLAPSTLLVGEG